MSAPHSTITDAAVVWSYSKASVVSKAEVKQIPVVGPATILTQVLKNFYPTGNNVNNIVL